MNKTTIKLVGIGALFSVLSGCSTVLKDNSDDYRHDKVNSVVLQAPEGSLRIRDDLVIPHENDIANVAPNSKFTVPRASFVFYPMAKVDVRMEANRVVLDVPATLTESKKMVKDFLMALHGDGESIASDTDTQIVSVPFQFVKQGWWASVWNHVSREFPEQIVFSFSFTKSEQGTLVGVQYRVEDRGEATTDWLSPTTRNDMYADTLRLWGDMARQLNKKTVYLSEQGGKAPFHVWIDHRGVLAIHLDPTQSVQNALSKQLKAASLAPVAGKENTLTVMPLVAGKMDAVAPNPTPEQSAAWDESEYHYSIIHQKAGDFLVIDVTSSPTPKITSFLLAQRFVK
ncbi:hypothetical protein [Marinomonas pollencensis]|uniref:Uncharacterized protein n=1 Tax=Marinomonas pollencensis TaxID=491954 RepID=A0A3E0DRK4_9GAMM|nr:hypothetical protein [Marinomonas pollencensis]REG85777.1 hypothetical protein DFP81_102316 [Marinomonas pollencensis]